MRLHELSAARIAGGVRSGEFSAQEVLKAFLSRIERDEPRVRAFLALFGEQALEAARAVDAKRAAGDPLGALAGVPVALKDNILVKGVETTCASKILRGHRSAYDAHVVERLRAADAVPLGKTNMDEFAMGSSTENSAFFKTANPWDTGRVPGGSSGGSAAAVAAGFAPLALGSDTGGSIRQPAAFCGVVGLKPTYGLVSRYGLVAFASSLDQIGPLSRTVEDAALALSVIAGHDARDTTSATAAPEAALKSGRGLSGLRVGLPKEYFVSGLDAEVEKSVREAIAALERLGARAVEISLPHTRYALSSYYIIAPSEASSNLARFDGVRYGLRAGEAASLEQLYERTRGQGFGPEVKRRIMLGTYALSSGYYDAYYAKAQRVRTLIARDFERVFAESVDLIAAPTTPTPPFRLGEKLDDPLSMYLSDVFTIPSNMAGNASLSIPCGLTAGGLPIGLQLIGGRFKEGLLLGAARALEAERPFPRLEAAA
ncbi:MAG: Asp-tRNA(Asn)/Glu-tRNA(Gln) amidotransferase subunit GatA [Elusimicrobia bacterium]|nr:Asp-tRNA(Asn)/Glu-tRNA(Gln) amidotransferase subunit GatA [Elusimicrobiota bacterium]MDE2426857.1 Asp-tRNA(Asn)/Glu-tRNA(Gln) amidotransferase subunit GatA [Elusimicrobiota bacterium]